MLSIPRDTIVYEPGCKARRSIGTGIFGPYQQAIIDGAMNIGGPSCAVKTVDDLTGLTLDHFVMFNFNSFRAMVDTIGGVEVCVPRSGYHDPFSGLNLSGGKHLLTRLKGTPAAQNTLAEPAPQAGTPGPVTLTLGADWAGLLSPAGRHAATASRAKGKGKAASGRASAAGQGHQAAVQTRNAGASICSGLPQANPNPGVP